MKEGEMIMTSAIDAWSCYLNSNEELKSPTSPNRLFCYTETTVFFPIHHVNHYYVVCFNMRNPSVEILDNRVSDRPLKNLYGQQLMVLHQQKIQIRRLRLLYTYKMISSKRNCMFEIIKDEIKDPTLVPPKDVLRQSIQKINKK
ncbi:hypothetical protein ACET3Z_028214 [Daucus carota]